MNNFIHSVQKKINQMKKVCQKDNLDQAIEERKNLAFFIKQLEELEERSTQINLLTGYLYSPSASRAPQFDPVYHNLKLIQPPVGLDSLLYSSKSNQIMPKSMHQQTQRVLNTTIISQKPCILHELRTEMKNSAPDIPFQTQSDVNFQDKLYILRK